MAKSSKAARRVARALILQILYEIDIARHHPAETLAAHLGEAELDESQESFVRAMVLGTLEHLETLDETIQTIAPEWPVEQMAPVDRNILRLAIYELRHSEETPLKVAINEAVELARIYGSDSSRRFVNGALGTFASDHLT